MLLDLKGMKITCATIYKRIMDQLRGNLPRNWRNTSRLGSNSLIRDMGPPHLLIMKSTALLRAKLMLTTVWLFPKLATKKRIRKINLQRWLWRTWGELVNPIISLHWTIRIKMDLSTMISVTCKYTLRNSNEELENLIIIQIVRTVAKVFINKQRHFLEMNLHNTTESNNNKLNR